MFLKIFELFSIFNWVTPTIGIIEDVINDPTLLQSNTWTFFVPYDQSLDNGLNVFDIENLMRRHGIKTWGEQITGGEFFFSVELKQARWAEYVLNRYNVPIDDRYGSPPRPEQKKKKLNELKRDDIIGDFFDNLFRF